MNRSEVVGAALAVFVCLPLTGCWWQTPPSLSYADFLAEVENGKVKHVTVAVDRLVVEMAEDATAEVSQTGAKHVVVPPQVDGTRAELFELLEEYNVPYTYDAD